METGQVANWNSEAPISGGRAWRWTRRNPLRRNRGREIGSGNVDVALEPKTLKVKDSYAANTGFAWRLS
jgi:hypothetical protein